MKFAKTFQEIKDAIDREIVHNALKHFYIMWDTNKSYARQIKRVAEDLGCDISDFDNYDHCEYEEVATDDKNEIGDSK